MIPGDRQSGARTGEAPPVTGLAHLRGFGPAGILTMMVIPFAGTPVIGAILVLVWARVTRTPLREIGLVRPRSWARAVAVGCLVGVAFKIVMKALVMPLFGTDPVNRAYHYLAGNAPAAAFMAVFVMVSGGFGEETVYRGFLFQRSRKVFGSRAGTVAKPLTLLLTTVWFAAVHYPDQGLAGVEQAAVTGLAFGTIFLMTGSLFIPMLAHATFDLAAIAIIYCDLETRVAHLLFR